MHRDRSLVPGAVIITIVVTVVTVVTVTDEDLAGCDVRRRATGVTHRVVERVRGVLLGFVGRVRHGPVAVVDQRTLVRVLRDHHRARVHVVVEVGVVTREVDHDRRRLRSRGVVVHRDRSLVPVTVAVAARHRARTAAGAVVQRASVTQSAAYARSAGASGLAADAA